MAQILRPVASTVGNYTVTGAASAHLAVDEAVLDTGDYAESPAAPSAEVIRFTLEDGVDPASAGSHVVHVVSAKNTSGGAQINVTIELIGTSTGSDVVHASTVYANIAATATDLTLTLTTAQINAIPTADYEGDTSGLSDLDIRVTITQV